MEMIEKRRAARESNDVKEEQRLHKQVRIAAKKNRTEWVDRLLVTGTWEQVKRLRKKAPRRPGKLRDQKGDLVDSDIWAETMAKHLENVQWCARPAGLVDGAPLGPELPVQLGELSRVEVELVIKKLRRKRAVGPDEIPAEYWQALASDERGLQWLTDLCNQCWREQGVPQAWHEAHVKALYKKGASDACENYRPISLLCVAYKVFAATVLQRLQHAGTEDRLYKIQFGLRRKCGTTEAIFAARRHIELAWAGRTSQVSMLALDWAKAFDSIDPAALVVMLARFGLPDAVLGIVKNIYSDRRFRVMDDDDLSSERRQRAGISQGRPVSPFLFVMLMTVVMEDAVAKLGDEDKKLHDRGALASVLYADDTLLVRVSTQSLQRFLGAVAESGARCGLQFHWGKFQLVQVRGDGEVKTQENQAIAKKDSLAYLGTMLYRDGSLQNELSRRLGTAWSDFSSLRSLWRHTYLSVQRKLEIWQSVVTTRLLYGMSSA